jgi:hypothetical protein
MNVRRTAACLTSAAALSVSGVAMAQPASAAPLFTGGLVNVNVQDVDVDVLNNSLNNNNIDILNDNEVNIGVAGQIIAQVCDVQVGVLSDLIRTGESTCDASGGTLTFTQVA